MPESSVPHPGNPYVQPLIHALLAAGAGGLGGRALGHLTGPANESEEAKRNRLRRWALAGALLGGGAGVGIPAARYLLQDRSGKGWGPAPTAEEQQQLLQAAESVKQVAPSVANPNAAGSGEPTNGDIARGLVEKGRVLLPSLPAAGWMAGIGAAARSGSLWAPWGLGVRAREALSRRFPGTNQNIGQLLADYFANAPSSAGKKTSTPPTATIAKDLMKNFRPLEVRDKMVNSVLQQVEQMRNRAIQDKLQKLQQMYGNKPGVRTASLTKNQKAEVEKLIASYFPGRKLPTAQTIVRDLGGLLPKTPEEALGLLARMGKRPDAANLVDPAGWQAKAPVPGQLTAPDNVRRIFAGKSPLAKPLRASHGRYQDMLGNSFGELLKDMSGTHSLPASLPADLHRDFLKANRIRMFGPEAPMHKLDVSAHPLRRSGPLQNFLAVAGPAAVYGIDKSQEIQRYLQPPEGEARRVFDDIQKAMTSP